MTNFHRRTLLIVALICWPAVAGAGEKNAAGIQFFENKIRPVLSTHCYECHSEKSKKLRADLLLDSKDGMLKGGVSGPALVPGKAKESLLLKALEHDGPTKMPSQNKKLSKEIIADFAKWIDMGAPDPRTGKAASGKRVIDVEKGRTFWSFQRLAETTPPAVKNPKWVKTPIDRFILAKLEEKSLAPNGPVAHERLLRRAYFDAIGLPPTPEEIDAFLKDCTASSPQAAYEKVIDRLLSSERFGERWARHWFDVVRFAESGGYEFDKDRPSAHHYRDFVIKAFNEGMPFDEFVRLQIAGDLLRPGDYHATAATGFLVAGPFPGQTTAKTIQLIRYDHLDDMLSTLGSSMLGLSLGCARCHEHKYDPIPQEDYYRLLANLSRTDSTDAKINTDAVAFAKAKAAFDQAHAPFLKARDDYERAELPKQIQAFWSTHKDRPAPPWLILDLVDAKGKSPLQKQSDGSVLATGKPQKNDAYTLVAHTSQKKIKALRLEALAEKNGLGLSADGGFLLTEVAVVATPLQPAAKAKIKPVTVKLKVGAVTAQSANAPLAAAIDGNAKTGWSVGASKDKAHAAVFEFEGDIGFDGGTVLTVTLKFDGDAAPIARPRLAIATGPAPLDGTAEAQLVSELRTVLAATKGEWKPEQRSSALPWWRKIDAKADAIYQALETHAKQEPQPKLVNVFSATGNKGGDVYFLIRGEVEKKREIAKAGFIQVLVGPADGEDRWLNTPATKKATTKDTRLALAGWITDPEHGAGHLLARVIVNRLWQHHMGKGIVATPNDFGAQGDAPTHPELLDFLARELIKNGWNLKPIHKLIMASAVYQLSPDVNATAQQADPKNTLWWRHPTRRLEAEAVRDAVLAVAGTLDTRMYGPGTLDVNNPRRSVYLTVKRSQMVPMLQMFDMPEPVQSIGERSVTTVPTQSLAFMNSPLVRNSAQKFAARIRPKTPQQTGAAIEQAYLIALGRRPTETERERMDSFIQRQAASYGSTPAARDQALADFCQVVMCLNEFIYVD